MCGNARHWCEVEVDRHDKVLSHGLSWRNYWSNMASPVFIEGVAAHVTHSYQPSKQVSWLSFEGMPHWIILWETGGQHRATDISLESLDCHMITRNLIWICVPSSTMALIMF